MHPTSRLAAVLLLAAGLALPSPAASADAATHAAADAAALRSLAAGDSLDPSPAALRAMLLHRPDAADGAAPALLGAAPRGRSIPLALALSAAVPGAGQAYNRQWVKAVVGVAAEVALIAGYRSLLTRGRDEEAAYQAYAHAHWDPAKYARWLEDYSAYLPGVDPRTIAVPQGIDFTRPDAWSAAERQEVRRFFDVIRAVESVVYHPTTGASFSHKLPYYGDQQYYELIGKYFQFAPGWVDYPAWREGDDFTGAIDPDVTDANGEKVYVQGRFWDYASDHAGANDLLRSASRVSTLIVLNHILAAVDAAVFAKLHNDRLDTSVRFTSGLDGRPVPVASLRVDF